MIERWIVQEWMSDYEFWQTWGRGTREYRWHEYANAVRDYEAHKKDFHYSPCAYRFCKIVIQPETIISKDVCSTFNELGEEINLTQTQESQTMKFT